MYPKYVEIFRFRYFLGFSRQKNPKNIDILFHIFLWDCYEIPQIALN